MHSVDAVLLVNVTAEFTSLVELPEFEGDEEKKNI